MSTLVNTSSTEISVLKQKHDELLKKSLLTRSQFEGQLKEKTKVISDLKVKEGKDIDTMIEMEKQIKSTFANPKYCKQAQSNKPCLYQIPYDTSDPANRFAPDGEEIVTLSEESRSKLDKDKVKPYNYTYQNSLYENFKPPSKAYLDQLERAKEVRKTISNSRTSNVNAVCAECGKCVFNSDHDACVSRYLKDVNARTKKPKVVPISASKPKRKANKSVATPHKKTVASDTTIQKSKSYYKKLYENTNQEWKWWIAKRCPSVYTWTQKPLRTKKIWMPKIRKDDESTSISPTIDIVSRITNIVQLILFIVDSNLKLLCNFVEKFLGTVCFGNEQSMTFEHSSSSLGRQCQMVSAENNTSGPVPQCSKDV
ncbi:hypothetical protein Tco_1482696 [Tanacetum coccineum]